MLPLPGGVWAQGIALWAGPGAAAVLLVACRCGPLLLAVPMLGVGGRLLALGLGTLLLAPLLVPTVRMAELHGSQLLPMCVRELLIGGALALAAAVPWAVATAVGSLADELRGDERGKLRRRPIAAQLYGALALALYFGLGGARIGLTALAASYELLPLPGAALATPAAAALTAAGQGVVTLSGRLLGLALQLALPLLCAQLGAELLVTLGARWRVLPMDRGARRIPAGRSLIWLVVLIVGARALFPELGRLVVHSPALLRQALDALAPLGRS